jgi:hypothetical protein
LAEEEKDGAVAPAEPVHTPLSEIVDKPRISEPPAKAITDEPRPEPRQRKSEKPAIPEGYVPLREVLDERDRRKQFEEKAQRYEQAWNEHQRRLAAEQDKDPAPDMFRDPNAYNQWVERQVAKRGERLLEERLTPLQQQLRDTTFELSMERTQRDLGPEKFGQLEQWITQQWNDQNGARVMQWCLNQPDPYRAVYAQYHQRTTLERLGQDDLDTYEKKLREKILAELRGPIDAPDSDIEEDDADFDSRKPPAPKSFASSRSADPARDPGGRFTGPKPLGAILAEKSPNRRKR